MHVLKLTFFRKTASQTAIVFRAASISLAAVILVLAFTILPLAAEGVGEEELIIGINERLGETVDLHFRFVDENGDSIYVEELVERPTVLSFVYFNCPGVCSPLLEGLQNTVDLVNLDLGSDFNVITISIDDTDTPAAALDRKNKFVQRFEKQLTGNQWKWLTGDSASIQGITDAVGFAFQQKEKDFAHSAALVILDGDGQVSRYLYGTSWNPFALQMAIFEASEGNFGPSVASVMKLCFSYDPEGRGYVLNVKRMAGVGILLGMLTMLLVLTRTREKAKTN